MISSETPGTTYEHRQRRVLIVDDETDLVLILTDILESRGYQVEKAHSAQGGRDKAEVFDAQVTGAWKSGEVEW